MGVRGDFAALAELRKQISGGKLRDRLLQAAAAEALTQVQLGFRDSRDPKGTPWAPLSRRDGMPLRNTGRLANSFSARPTATGFVVGTNVAYAPFHQYGTKGRSSKRGGKTRGRALPARPMIPEGDLGPIWLPAITRAVESAFKKFWR